jgi:murein DD-endopeptidase MepM/ murein hydrolase activator NlpD
MRIIEALIAIIVLVFLAALLFGNGNFAFGATEDQLKNQIATTNDRIAEIQAEIAALGDDLETTSQQRLTLENELARIEQTRQSLLKELELTSTKIDKTNLNIENLNNEITDKEKRIAKQKRAIGQTIRQMYEFDQYTPFEMLLSEQEISDVWHQVDQLVTLQDSSRRHIRNLQGLQTELRGSVAEKEEEKEELESLKDDIEDQKELVEQNKQEQAALVSSTKNREDFFQQQIQVKQSQLDAFEAELKEYESQLKFLANPDALPPRGSGVLSWPLDSMLVTQHFGAKTGPHRSYTYGHSGTDFRARTPQKLYAMADGVVMGTGNTDVACRGVSFGKWITIEHDNGLVSTSAHLSIINVKAGDRVSRGQQIGYTGNTGRSTAPHLHMSLYAGVDANGANPVEVSPAPSRSCYGKTITQPRASRDAYLNPLDYLGNFNAIQYKAGLSRS